MSKHEDCFDIVSKLCGTNVAKVKMLLGVPGTYFLKNLHAVDPDVDGTSLIEKSGCGLIFSEIFSF